MDKSQFDLQQHLKEEHKQNPISEFLKQIVYGGIDGIVTTFAVVASFSGAAFSGVDPATASFITVLLFGVGNLVADGMSMGLGEYLSTRSEQDHHRKLHHNESQQIIDNLAQEEMETNFILETQGFSAEQARTITEVYKQNPKYWADWMVQYELGAAGGVAENPVTKGIATFISFLIFGAIPLIPYAVFSTLAASTVFVVSIGATLFALLLLGLVRWKVTGENLLRSIGEVIIIGSVAAVAAFIVGALFG